MKILIASDKFKGSLNAEQVCNIVSSTISNCGEGNEIISIPMADGGEGWLKALSAYFPSTEKKIVVKDPLFREVSASYLISDDRTAFIEMAEASGLLLLGDTERNPLKTSSYGTGELIRHALQQNVKKIVLGIGGSATNDAGCGMAAALGYKFLDEQGNELQPCGENLERIKRIDRGNAIDLRNVRIEVACDVNNPLFGHNGAAYVYAPQKGADAAAVELLDRGLRNFAKVAADEFSKEIDKVPGAGAAGGMGAGALTFLNATLKWGIDLLFEYAKVEEIIADADLIISGEGKLDKQSLQGKVVFGVAALCRKHSKPLIILCGKNELSRDEFKTAGIMEVYSLTELAGNTAEAYSSAALWLKEAAGLAYLNFNR